jgi:hypothetical protein
MGEVLQLLIKWSSWPEEFATSRRRRCHQSKVPGCSGLGASLDLRVRGEDVWVLRLGDKPGP